MLPIAWRSPLPTHRAGRGSRNSGVALRRGFIFLLANSSDGQLIGCAAPPPRTGAGDAGPAAALSMGWGCSAQA